MELKLGTERLIDEAIVAASKKEVTRDYMGASILGEECDRKLWYMYKQPKQILDPRIQRIFKMGHMIEEYIVNLLRDAGFTVYDVDNNGNQFGFTDGRIAGHCDGVIVGLPESSKPHLLEIKSSKDSIFKQFLKNGCEKTNEKYWAQLHIYMDKMKLDRALFVVMNKDTCALYFERVEYQKYVADHHLLRGHDLASMDKEPSRKYNKSTFYKCRWCDWNKECWQDEKVDN